MISNAFNEFTCYTGRQPCSNNTWLVYKVGQELSEEGVLRNQNTAIIHVVLVHFLL